MGVPMKGQYSGICIYMFQGVVLGRYLCVGAADVEECVDRDTGEYEHDGLLNQLIK